jgi:hypothetical protein
MHTVLVLVDPIEAEQCPVVATCLIWLGKESSKSSDNLKSSVFWDIMLQAGFLLGLFFKPEEGRNMLVDFQQTARHYIPENRTLPGPCQELNPDSSKIQPIA